MRWLSIIADAIFSSKKSAFEPSGIRRELMPISLAVTIQATPPEWDASTVVGYPGPRPQH